MKKISVLSILVTILCFVTLFSCNKKEKEIASLERSIQINLIAPSGIAIAEDIEGLKLKSAAHIESQHGKNIKFDIISTEFCPVYKKGYFVIINYRLENGVESNFAELYHHPEERVSLNLGDSFTLNEVM